MKYVWIVSRPYLAISYVVEIRFEKCPKESLDGSLRVFALQEVLKASNANNSADPASAVHLSNPGLFVLPVHAAHKAKSHVNIVHK